MVGRERFEGEATAYEPDARSAAADWRDRAFAPAAECPEPGVGPQAEGRGAGWFERFKGAVAAALQPVEETAPAPERKPAPDADPAWEALRRELAEAELLSEERWNREKLAIETRAEPIEPSTLGIVETFPASVLDRETGEENFTHRLVLSKMGVGSPAEKAGLRVGDQIHTVDGVKMALFSENNGMLFVGSGDWHRCGERIGEQRRLPVGTTVRIFACRPKDWNFDDRTRFRMMVFDVRTESESEVEDRMARFGTRDWRVVEDRG